MQNKSQKSQQVTSKWVRVLSILLLALLMPFLFIKPTELNATQFIITFSYSLVITIGIWQGNAFLVGIIRNKLKWDVYPLKRLATQVLVTLIYSDLFFLAVSFIFHTKIPSYEPLGSDFLISIIGVNAVTLLINAVYESIYFSRRWRFSVMRTEVLKRSALRSQYESLKNHINPHFLFNSLNTLNCLIEEDSKEAIHFVQSLADAYRYLLQNKEAELVTLRDELLFTKTYAYLLTTRFGEGLHIIFEIDEQELDRKLPPLCLQILVENAVEYNLVSTSSPLHINIIAKDRSLIVTNNVQLKFQQEENTKLGIETIRERYQELSSIPVKVTQTFIQYTVSLPLI